MAKTTITTCDFSGCGKDITQGDGRYWRLTLMAERVAMRGAGDPAGKPPRWNAHSTMEPKHFCGPQCLVGWASTAALADDAGQIQHEEDQRAAEEIASRTAAREAQANQ